MTTCAMTVPNLRYANPLRKGSRVFLAAPSSGVDSSTWARLDLVIGNLEARGLVVEEGTCLRRETQKRERSSRGARKRTNERVAAR